MEKEEVLDLYYKGIVAEGKEDMVSILERMFYVIESDYHFDDDNYMLKLVM